MRDARQPGGRGTNNQFEREFEWNGITYKYEFENGGKLYKLVGQKYKLLHMNVNRRLGVDTIRNF